MEYRGHTLYLEGVPLADIAKRHGTPCYVYSRAAVLEKFRAYETAFGKAQHQICYAVKANGNLAKSSSPASVKRQPSWITRWNKRFAASIASPSLNWRSSIHSLRAAVSWLMLRFASILMSTPPHTLTSPPA